MKATIYPGKISSGSIKLPPSKSIAHRSIICGSLASGKSVISNIDYSMDINATIEAMKAFGAHITKNNDSLIIEGISEYKSISKVIDCNESGSTLRFLIPIATLFEGSVKYTGSKKLLERPQSVYSDLFKEKDISFLQDKDIIEVNGVLTSGTYKLKGDVSSQFISGLLFVLPLLNEDSIIEVSEPFESKSYVDLTIDCLRKFGVDVEKKADNIFLIKGNQKYIATDTKVESDYSQMAFFASLGLINDSVECLNMNHDSLQGDKQFIEIVKDMGGKVTKTSGGYLFEKSTLHSTLVDLKDCPDLGPMLMSLATFASGETTFINAERLRIKESDRISAIEEELRKFNVEISSDNEKVVVKSIDTLSTDKTLNSHNDHRIVMALAIISTVAKNKVVIEDAQAINKSYPSFFEDLRKLGIKVDVEE